MVGSVLFGLVGMSLDDGEYRITNDFQDDHILYNRPNHCVMIKTQMDGGDQGSFTAKIEILFYLGALPNT